MAVNSYQDLDVWQVAMDLCESSYRLTASFLRDEAFGMTSQIRRAAVSIPANIAEGYGRDSTGAFIQFLRIAQGSSRELETHLVLVKRLKLASDAAVAEPWTLCERVSKMLRSLIRSIEAKSPS